MLQLQPIEFFLRAIPEGFFFVFGVYVFSRTSIDKKKYIISSIIFSVVMFIVRLLPINYGVHTILALIFLMIITSTYNNIDVIKAMSSVLIVVLIQFLMEGINILILNLVSDFDILFKNPVLKTILGLPSLIMSTIIVYIFYLLYKKKEV